MLNTYNLNHYSGLGEVDPNRWTVFRQLLDGAAGYPEGGLKAAIHSGLDAALESHPCVALSSGQASLLYGGYGQARKQNHPFWRKAINPGGMGAAPPS